MSSAFGSGPSNGQFWFGGSSFPGFLYKKNLDIFSNATLCYPNATPKYAQMNYIASVVTIDAHESSLWSNMK